MNVRRRWPMEGIANFRDLGGYDCPGGTTRWGVFYRCAKMSEATGADLALLQKLGIQAVLDLRYPAEFESQPDRLPEGVQRRNVSLMGPVLPADFRINAEVAHTRTLVRMYKRMLRHAGGQIVQALEFLADTDGPVAFHCMAGKDRTGVIAMFLFSLLGVAREDIIADYEVSHGYILRYTDDVSGSHWSNMEQLLRWLDKEYGGPVAYLHGCGLSPAAQQKLRSRFLCPED